MIKSAAFWAVTLLVWPFAWVLVNACDMNQDEPAPKWKRAVAFSIWGAAMIVPAYIHA